LDARALVPEVTTVQPSAGSDESSSRALYLKDAVEVIDLDPLQLAGLRVGVHIRGEEPDRLGGPASVGDLEDSPGVQAPFLRPLAPCTHHDRGRVHQHAVQVEEDRLTLEGSHRPILPFRHPDAVPSYALCIPSASACSHNRASGA